MYYGVVPCGLWLLVVVGWRIYAILSAHFLRPDSLSDRFMHNKCEQTFFIKLVYLYICVDRDGELLLKPFSY